MNDKRELIEEAVEAAREAWVQWPEELDLSNEEVQTAGFHVLVSAGELFRLTGDKKVLDILRDLPWQEERRKLITAACLAISTRGLVERLKILGDPDHCIEDEDLLFVEEALLVLDRLGVVRFMVDTLTTSEAYRGEIDFERLKAVGHARAQIEILKEALVEGYNKPATLVSLSIFDGLKPQLSYIDELWWWLRIDGQAIIEAEEEVFMKKLFGKQP